jgi:hypothetical protein
VRNTCRAVLIIIFSAVVVLLLLHGDTIRNWGAALCDGVQARHKLDTSDLRFLTVNATRAKSLRVVRMQRLQPTKTQRQALSQFSVVHWGYDPEPDSGSCHYWSPQPPANAAPCAPISPSFVDPQGVVHSFSFVSVEDVWRGGTHYVDGYWRMNAQ